MKAIFKLIYSFFLLVDKVVTGNYETYSGETAPFCGHAYYGHKGFFTHSHYDEINGFGETRGYLLSFGIDDSGRGYCYSCLARDLKNFKLNFIIFEGKLIVCDLKFRKYHRIITIEFKNKNLKFISTKI